MKRKAYFQGTLATQTGFEKYARKNRREEFLNVMDVAVPWRELEALLEPHYPKTGNGRQPVGLSIMLRVYFLQQWFNLSDPSAEDALYESPVRRRFAGVDLGSAAAPDETTILHFRRLLERHELCGQILDTVNHYLASKGLRIATGTIVDATIIRGAILHEEQQETEAIHAAEPQAQDMTSRRAKYKGGVDERERRKNRTQATVRSKVEWPSAS